MPTQLEATAALTADYRTHKDNEECPGSICANYWHRFDRFLATHCRTCGAGQQLGCSVALHVFWELYKGRGAMPKKAACGPRTGKALTHYQAMDNLEHWYTLEQHDAGLEWLRDN